MLNVGREHITAHRIRPSAREKLPQSDQPRLGFSQGR